MAARLTAEQRRLRAIPESAWMSRVMDYATIRRWLVYHAPENRPVIGRAGKPYIQNIRRGWPDLAMVRGNRLVFAELKTEVGKASEEQQEWLEALRMAGAECHLWRPSDWDQVQQALR